MNILADTVSTVAGSVIPPGAEPSRGALMTVVCGAVFLPLGLTIKSEKSLSAVAFLVRSLAVSFWKMNCAEIMQLDMAGGSKLL